MQLPCHLEIDQVIELSKRAIGQLKAAGPLSSLHRARTRTASIAAQTSRTSKGRRIQPQQRGQVAALSRNQDEDEVAGPQHRRENRLRRNPPPAPRNQLQPGQDHEQGDNIPDLRNHLNASQDAHTIINAWWQS